MAGNHRKTRRDISLLVIVLVAVVIIAAGVAPIIYANVISIKYKDFTNRYADSINASRNAGTVTASWDDGKTKTVDIEKASQIYSVLLTAGMGKPQTRAPESPSVKITFADGAFAQFWETEIKEKTVNYDIGLYVRYHAADGFDYQYDTDKVTFQSIEGYLS